MSDVRSTRAGIEQDRDEDCPPTERDPSAAPPSLPARGVALSVLWWRDDDRAVVAPPSLQT